MKLGRYEMDGTYEPLVGQNTESSGSANEYTKKSSDNYEIEAFIRKHACL